MKVRQEISNILVEENTLMEIVKLMGTDVLPDDQKLLIETARAVRVGFYSKMPIIRTIPTSHLISSTA